MHTGLKKKSDTGCILEMALAAVSKEGNTFGEGGELKLAVSDTPGGGRCQRNGLYNGEMSQPHNLNIYKYLNYLQERLPGTAMSDEELAKLVPWNETDE